MDMRNETMTLHDRQTEGVVSKVSLSSSYRDFQDIKSLSQIQVLLPQIHQSNLFRTESKPYNMAHIVKGPRGSHAHALLPGTCHVHLFTSEEDYAEVFRKGTECLDAINPLPGGYIMDLLEKWRLYARLIKKYTMPEFINIVDGEGIWRVPYYPRTGGSRAKYMTEAVATLMCDVSDARYKTSGLGAREFAGDIFAKGPLRDEEYQKIVHGQFPSTMTHLGGPGAGVCEAPERVLVIESTSVRPPRAPRGRDLDYNDNSVDFGAPPPRRTGPPPQRVRPGQYGPPHQGGRPAQYGPLRYPGPPGQRGPSRQPLRPGYPHQPPRKYITSASASDSTPDSSADSSSESHEEEEPSRKVPKGKAPKGKAPKGKPKGKPSRRQRSPSVESHAAETGDLALSEGEPRGQRNRENPIRKPTRRRVRFEDEDEASAIRPPRRPAARGPPRRGPLPEIEVRDFAPTDGKPQAKLPKTLAAPKTTRRIGRCNDEDDGPTPPSGRRTAAAGPPRRGSPPKTRGEDSLDTDRPSLIPERVDARRQERRRQGRELSEDEEPPELDPAEKTRLEALKAANGFGKGMAGEEKKGLH